MTQSGGVDPSDQSYGVFINSNQSNVLSTEKSTVVIPFLSNIVDHDPNKTVQVALTSMMFTNTIYNITKLNQNLNILIYYAAGRGKAASFEEIACVITQLSNYLSQANIVGKEIVQQLFLYQNIESFCNIFSGFGAIPADPNDPIITKACPTNDSNTKILFQSPDLAHMIQYGTDLTTATDNFLKHSYIYAGIYIECDLEDTRYSPLLKMLGYFNINTAPPDEIALSIPFGERRYGYGMTFTATTAKNPGEAFPYDNTVFYKVNETDLLSAKNIIFADPLPFNGFVYQPPGGSTTVILTCAYELDTNGQVIELTNGYYISGSGISIPSPYIVGYQDCKAVITLEVGSSEFYISAPPGGSITGTLSLGMAMGSAYDADGEPLDVGFANQCDYGLGTSGAGIENNRCFYIVSIDPGGLSGTLNQNWTFALQDFTNDGLFTNYVLTTPQSGTPGGLVENMLASPNTIAGITGILTPDNVTNLSGVDEIHIHCSQLRTKNLSSIYFQPLAPSDVIAVIPVEVEFGFKQSYQPPNPLSSFLNNTNITHLEITLSDSKGELLNFHGVDWSLTLFVTESDAVAPSALAKEGNFNTPFQDQLATLEGTHQAEIKKKRQITFMQNGDNGNFRSKR